MLLDTTILTQAELKSAIVRNPLVVTPDTKVMNAIAQMSGVRTICSASRAAESQLDELHIEARSSCVFVIKDDQLLGVLTERDVVRLSAQRRSLENLPIGDVMTHPVITLRESAFTDLFSTINLLQQHRIRHLAILDEQDHLTGLLTHESLRQTSRPVDLLRLRLVAEVMTVSVICADPDVSMLAIAHLMAEHRVSSVMIVQNQSGNSGEIIQTPIGIVTERDVVQFQALSLDLETCLAQSVMSTPIFSVCSDDSLWVVHQTMEQRFIRRLAVTGAQGELLGIVTQSSLLQALNPLELYNLAGVLEQKVLRLEAEKVELLESRTLELEKQVEERTRSLKAKAGQEQLITSIAIQIRSSLNLHDILNTTVGKVQAILNCDRVAIWQIQPDWQMLAVAEATSGKTSPQLGQQICDPCFVPDWSEAYRKGRVLVVSDIYTTQIAGCHRAFLEQLQIRAKVLIPIIQGDTLWGLMEAVESHAPRQWHPDEVALLEQLATQLAIAIQQATAYQQLQTELLEREQTEARLRESEQRYATLAAAAPVGIYRTDAVGNYLYVNQRWCAIAGLTPEAALGMGWRKGLHSGDRDNIAEEWHRADQESRPFQLEYRFQRLDGTVTWVFGQAVAERNANEQITGYVGTITDINDLKQAQELIIHNALHDPLTGLPNRTRLVERLELAMNRARRIENYNYAVLFLDLDRFKVINDSLGHWVGDQVLTIIAQKLKTHLRNIDLVVRLGGDEFMILLEDMTTTEDIIQVAERVSSDCQTPITVNGYEMFTSLSIGIVLGSKDYHQASDLIRDADTAMYQAKAQGRSSYKFFDAAMHAEALKRLTLETDLRKALQREEFVVYYQPIVDILSDRLIGFEALVRWQHPTRGFVSPADFIPIAEETGLIVPLDSWVFRTACQQLASWKVKFADCFPLKISINLSAQDLRKASLIEDIDQVLTETGLEGDLITLEVTESMLLEDISQTIDLLTQLKTRKIQISIDDFGTGYSSLNYLHRLPADNLKIDRSFVNQMQTENRNYQVVSTIIALSNQLGLTVVAEGIETQQQLQWLRQLGCEFGQGYLFSKPLAAHEIETHFLQSKATTALWETES
jgi:diguanylate cyclase (GGDEF)-like protein/PAS domain S-box-containing protein